MLKTILLISIALAMEPSSNNQPYIDVAAGLTCRILQHTCDFQAKISFKDFDDGSSTPYQHSLKIPAFLSKEFPYLYQESDVLQKYPILVSHKIKDYIFPQLNNDERFLVDFNVHLLKGYPIRDKSKKVDYDLIQKEKELSTKLHSLSDLNDKWENNLKKFDNFLKNAEEKIADNDEYVRKKNAELQIASWDAYSFLPPPKEDVISNSDSDEKFKNYYNELNKDQKKLFNELGQKAKYKKEVLSIPIINQLTQYVINDGKTQIEQDDYFLKVFLEKVNETKDELKKIKIKIEENQKREWKKEDVKIQKIMFDGPVKRLKTQTDAPEKVDFNTLGYFRLYLLDLVNSNFIIEKPVQLSLKLAREATLDFNNMKKKYEIGKFTLS